MLDRATNALRDAVSRLRGDDGAPADLLASGERQLSLDTRRELGLFDQPFSDQTPPAKLYVDHAIRMQTNVLASQLAENEMLPVVRGESGSGKTSLLIRLMTDHAGDMHFFVARGRAGLEARQIVVDMLRMLVRPVPADPSECYRDLARRLRALVADGLPATLVIDDADCLDDQELQNLLSLHDSLRRTLNGRFRMLLGGGPGLDSRLTELDSEQLRTGQMVTSDVRPLSRPGIASFLEHRLRAVGLDRDNPLTDTDLERIHAASGGLPRDVEIAAAAALEARFGAHPER